MDAKRTFFVTAVTARRRPIFRDAESAQLLIDMIYEYRAQGRFALHEFVVMPDHEHLLLTPAATLSLERVMQFIKGGFSFRVGKIRPELTIWEKSFTNHRIRDERDYGQHREYIHQNAVRKGLAIAPEEYPYSSAHTGFELDPAPFATAAKAGAR